MYPDILQHLRVNSKAFTELGHLLFPCQHDLHHLEAGQNTVTGAGIFTEDNMTALLTADAAAILCHILIDVLVANSGFRVSNTTLIKCFVESKVTHDRRNDCVVHQLTAFLHVPAIDVKNVVSSKHVTLFIHAQAPVSVPIIGKAHIALILYHKLLQTTNVC